MPESLETVFKFQDCLWHLFFPDPAFFFPFSCPAFVVWICLSLRQAVHNLQGAGPQTELASGAGCRPARGGMENLYPDFPIISCAVSGFLFSWLPLVQVSFQKAWFSPQPPAPDCATDISSLPGSGGLQDVPGFPWHPGRSSPSFSDPSWHPPE